MDFKETGDFRILIQILDAELVQDGMLDAHLYLFLTAVLIELGLQGLRP